MMIRLFLLACALVLVTVVPILAEEAAPAEAAATTTPATPGAMTPEMRQRMAAMMQDILVMSQNTAVDTPEGIVVLQGNRLLQLDNNTLAVKHTLTLPAVAMPAMTGTTDQTAPLRSMVPAKLLVQANGDVIVVRGQQVIRVAKDLTIAKASNIPNLPMLTQADLYSVSPLAMYVHMMAMGMGMAGTPAAFIPIAPAATPVADGAGEEKK